MSKEVFVFPPEASGVVRRNWRLGLRLVFGAFWCVDAILKWTLLVQGINYADLIMDAAKGQPDFIASWIKYWANVAAAIPSFTILISLGETIVALFIILGFLTKLTSLFGIAFNFLVWTTAEAFGGVFTSGATDIGASPLYMAMFAGLIVVQAGKQHGLDAWLTRKYPRLAVLL